MNTITIEKQINKDYKNFIVSLVQLAIGFAGITMVWALMLILLFV